MAFLWNEAAQRTFWVSTSDPTGHKRPPHRQLAEPAMVDRASLEVLGFILGGVTALVIAIAVIVVRSHVGGNGFPTEQSARSAPVLPASLSTQR